MQRFNYDHKVPQPLSERFDKWFLHEYARIIQLCSQPDHFDAAADTALLAFCLEHP